MKVRLRATGADLRIAFLLLDSLARAEQRGWELHRLVLAGRLTD